MNEFEELSEVLMYALETCLSTDKLNQYEYEEYDKLVTLAKEKLGIEEN